MKVHVVGQHKHITAVDLLREGYDIVLATYEAFHAACVKVDTFKAKLDKWRRIPEEERGAWPTPVRPSSVLLSEVWKVLGVPFKLVLMDEAHRVQKADGMRHCAIRDNCWTNGYVFLSATIASNQWHGLFGYLDFVGRQPFRSLNAFLHAFADKNASGDARPPGTEKIALLQRLFQAFTIIRPKNTLEMPPVKIERVLFELGEDCVNQVKELTLDFFKCLKRRAIPLDYEDITSTKPFGKATEALMAALHPLCYEGKGKRARREMEDEAEVVEDEREAFLKRVRVSESLVEDSGRLSTLVKFLDWIREDGPNEKTIVFSVSMKFLDTVAEALDRKGMKVFRYDDSIPLERRASIMREFKDAKGWAVPSLHNGCR